MRKGTKMLTTKYETHEKRAAKTMCLESKGLGKAAFLTAFGHGYRFEVASATLQAGCLRSDIKA